MSQVTPSYQKCLILIEIIDCRSVIFGDLIYEIKLLNIYIKQHISTMIFNL